MTEPLSKSCSSWAQVTEAFDSFPHERLGRDIDWEIDESLWIFRGHKRAEYRLEPSIEREVATKHFSWPALEVKILEEFQSPAPMHLSRSDVPKAEDRLSWLALMQHYGIPTRLLDFTL